MYNKKITAVLIVGLFGQLYAVPEQPSTKSTTPPTAQPIEASQKYPLDKTLAIIYHPEKIEIVTTSDMRPGVDGVPKTFKQVVQEKLMVLDGKELKIEVSDEDVDRYLVSVQKEHNLSREDVLKLFQQAGLTEDQAREDLRNQQLIQMVIDARTRSKTAVTSKDIEAYYAQNPVEIPGEITFALAFAPFEHYKSKDKQRQELKKAIENREIDEAVTWMDPVTLSLKDVPAERAFLKELTPGVITTLEEQSDGTQLIKIITKTPDKIAPLKELEKDITMRLRMERRGQAIAEYQEQLLKQARIKYLDENYRPQE